MQGRWLRRPTGDTTVIFLHGIFSSSETWRHKNNTYVPDLLVSDRRSKSLGVYVFDYHTSLTSAEYSISEISQSLEENMRLDGVEKSKSYIFVCHSMGGIVARRYIIRCQASLINKQKSIGLFLIASPSIGSKYANWLSPLARIARHRQGQILPISESNQWLNDLDRDFSSLNRQQPFPIYGKELLEDKFIAKFLFFIFKPVVSRLAGGRYFDNPSTIPNSTHFTIASVEGPHEIQYRLLIEFISKVDKSVQSDTDFDPSTGHVVIDFADDIRAELTKCQLATQVVAGKRPKIQISWPKETLNLIQSVNTVMDLAANDPKNQIFSALNNSTVADIILSGQYKISRTNKIMDLAEQRAQNLVNGMYPYWRNLDGVVAKSLANFITICNIEILINNADLLYIIYACHDKIPDFVKEMLNTTDKRDVFRRVFEIKEPLASTKIYSIGGNEVPYKYFWGPQSDVISAIRWRVGDEIPNTWFDKYVVPQNEFRLLENNYKDVVIYMNEEIRAVKLRDDDEERLRKT